LISFATLGRLRLFFSSFGLRIPLAEECVCISHVWLLTATDRIGVYLSTNLNDRGSQDLGFPRAHDLHRFGLIFLYQVAGNTGTQPHYVGPSASLQQIRSVLTGPNFGSGPPPQRQGEGRTNVKKSKRCQQGQISDSLFLLRHHQKSPNPRSTPIRETRWVSKEPHHGHAPDSSSTAQRAKGVPADTIPERVMGDGTCVTLFDTDAQTALRKRPQASTRLALHQESLTKD